MQTLKNWTLDHENPDGITLSVEDRHLLHIIVLEDDTGPQLAHLAASRPQRRDRSPACEPRRLYLPARYHQRNCRRPHRQR